MISKKVISIFNEDLFNRYAWEDGTMNFNNCSLMMLEILQQIESENNDELRQKNEKILETL